MSNGAPTHEQIEMAIERRFERTSPFVTTARELEVDCLALLKEWCYARDPQDRWGLYRHFQTVYRRARLACGHDGYAGSLADLSEETQTILNIDRHGIIGAKQYQQVRDGIRWILTELRARVPALVQLAEQAEDVKPYPVQAWFATSNARHDTSLGGREGRIPDQPRITCDGRSHQGAAGKTSASGRRRSKVVHPNVASPQVGHLPRRT